MTHRWGAAVRRGADERPWSRVASSPKPATNHGGGGAAGDPVNPACVAPGNFVQLLAIACASSDAKKLGLLSFGPDIAEGKRLDIRHALMAYTAPFNLTGYPVATVPMRRRDGLLPAGLQIVGSSRTRQRSHRGRDRDRKAQRRIKQSQGRQR
jgi:hypothetical protein